MDRYQDLKQKKEKILQMGGIKAIEQQHKSGKWTARERVEYFFDPGTFTEIGMFVKHRTTAFGMDKREIPAEGVVVGYGKVNGRYVMVAAEDYTSMAGTFGEYHGKKFSQAIDMAKEMGIPFVGMNDSGGARLQEGMDTLQAYAWLFRSQILASGIIPQIALLMGPCLGGQAYHPVMQDFIIQCRRTGFMGIAGPAFVKTQLGEEISLEELCGVRVHAAKTGQTHVVAEDDRDCLDKAKELLSYLPQNNREKPPRMDTGDEAERIIQELDYLVPEEMHVPFDMHEVIYKVVDNGVFFEIMKDFAKNVIIGFARIAGRSVGIVASQPLVMGGVIDCDAADKIARFVRFCDLFNVPLVNFHDTPGYMIGSHEEHKGILRHGAKMLYAYIDATVPKVTVIIRKSFAGAYTGMCCKDTGADFVFAWPIARVSIVGAETAASVIFAKEIKNADDPARVAAERIQQYRDFCENPYRGAERGYIDDIIMPSETRRYVARALDILENKQVARPWRKYSNINL
ncbi:Propionyl-CoA carboxylase [Desulfofundulus kuznetsovii DSM 6115]|uniref:Propionyl-CoA carboxylase n=1 Tax=Desulfofundulus kuznetsovii (strain DSM 6115 / VKM B-1805 / 17) TaxID=760568 RepID=A0AAU8PX49_DESK7|nr:Propionyl-CoA carboxylase [Desulfofundulus kuznetsovii DSM 6115]